MGTQIGNATPAVEPSLVLNEDREESLSPSDSITASVWTEDSAPGEY